MSFRKQQESGPISASSEKIVLPGQKRDYLLGIVYVTMYNVLCGANEVYSANLVLQLNPFVVAFFTSFITAIFFNIFQLKDFKRYIIKIKNNSRDVLLVNITTLFIWLSFFISLEVIEPAIVATIIGTIGPIAVVILGRYLRPDSKVLGVEIFSAVGIFGTLIVLIWFSLTGKSAVGDNTPDSILVGIIAALVCGITISAHIFFCKRLNESGWDAVSIMSVRFFLLIVCALFITVSQEQVGVITKESIIPLLLIALGGVTIPLYLLQISIKICEPISFSLLFATGPFFTLVLQLIDTRLTWSIYSTGGIFAIIFFVVISVFARHRSFI